MELVLGVIFAFVLIALITTVISLLGIMLEKKGYNNGRCPRCGDPLDYFDTDSQGGRGYYCDYCGYTTWVSYRIVDKHHKE